MLVANRSAISNPISRSAERAFSSLSVPVVPDVSSMLNNTLILFKCVTTLHSTTFAHTQREMLQAPKRQEGAKGVHLLQSTSLLKSPRLRYEVVGGRGSWVPTSEWQTWADDLRAKLIGELLSHGTAWFRKTPRRETIESLFPPIVGRTMAGALQFSITGPLIPGGDERSGVGSWRFRGITMSGTGISTLWETLEFISDPEEDKISLFGDGETVDGRDEDGVDRYGDEKEITFEELPTSSDTTAMPQIRSRDWEARKFVAKERVREYRLKAQIADKMALKEEERFIRQFGELDENESQFSDYDLTDDEGGGASSVDSSVVA